MYIKEKQVPILLERQDNLFFQFKVTATTGYRLDEAILRFAEGSALNHVNDVKLAFAMQYTDFDDKCTPHSGIMYSEDRGETWKLHAPAKDVSLMLNMRDNRGGGTSPQGALRR
ncbi:MAG: hypothetical protein IK143_00640 [Bacteroidales bacterium]|nr:hypothetical protein [Bacteroidales bacterium]